MDVEAFPNHSDGPNEKSWIKGFPHWRTIDLKPNSASGHQSTSASGLKEEPCTKAPPSSNLLEQNPLNEAPLPCH